MAASDAPPLAGPPIHDQCPICRSPSWYGALCWPCQQIRDYSDVARAFCNGLHRGDWPQETNRATNGYIPVALRDTVH